MDFQFVNLNLDRIALHRELNTSSGGLWKELEIAGEKAVIGAKANVGFKTGRLRRSIHKRHQGTSVGQFMQIGSWTVPYALDHHQGTRAHLILPKEAGGILVFGSRGRVVRTPGPVRHPGTKANPYLTRELRHFRWK